MPRIIRTTVPLSYVVLSCTVVDDDVAYDTCDASTTRRIWDERTKRREEERPSSSSRHFNNGARSGSGASTDAMTHDDTFDCCRDHGVVVYNTRLGVGVSGTATTTADVVTLNHKMIGDVEDAAPGRDGRGVSSNGRRIFRHARRGRMRPGGKWDVMMRSIPTRTRGDRLSLTITRIPHRARGDDARRARDYGSHRATAKGHRCCRPRHGGGNRPEI